MTNPIERAPEQPRDASKALGNFSEALKQGKNTVDPDTARAAIEALAKHGLSDPAEIQRIIAALQPAAVQEQRKAVLEKGVEYPTRAWTLYENSVLQREIAKLSTEEKVLIDRMTAHLVNEVSSFLITATKPLGAPKAPRGVDHVSFSVKEDPSDNPKLLRKNLPQSIDPTIYEALIPGDLSQTSALVILPHPGNPNKKLLVGKLMTPGNEATMYPHDHRGGGQYFYMILPSKSKILSFLRENQNIRLFSHIYQNAAVELNRESLSYVDAPLSGRYSQEAQKNSAPNPLVVLDVPNMRITVVPHTQNREIAPRLREYDTADDFQKSAKIYLGDARPPELGRWGQLPDKYRS